MENATSKKQNYLKGVIDRFESKFAVIKTDDGQTIHWPIAQLPQECEQGTAVRILLKTSQDDQKDREELAKTILNKLLRKN